VFCPPELPVSDHYLVIPYKSVQPPLYYVIAGLVAHVAPPEPKTVLYIGRLVSVLFGAGTVYFLLVGDQRTRPRCAGPGRSRDRRHRAAAPILFY
jgi:hypothetical protein